MRTISRGVCVGFALLLSAPAFADTKADVEGFMWKYLDLWNAHDAGAIVDHVYRLPDSNPWHTKNGLQAEFDRLKAQGYDRSDTQSVTGCILGPDRAQVELRYTRLKTDGSFMPPKERVSVYQLQRFPDGWRVVGFAGLAAGARMDCPKG
jgi:hypothetical protein